MFSIFLLFGLANAAWNCKTCTTTGGSQSHYCLSPSDLIVAYGNNVTLHKQGWQINGGGGVATKAAFNLLGGSVEFNVSIERVNAEVNTNLYGISPVIASSGFTQNNLCDGSAQPTPRKCLEVDWVENNGKCMAATTIHAKPGSGIDGCNGWGCYKFWKIDHNYKLKITYSTDGNFKVYKDGSYLLSSADLIPKPTALEIATIAANYKKNGTVLYSSQWRGWVPARTSCPLGGNLDTSIYRISGLVIIGSVVQGPVPAKC